MLTRCFHSCSKHIQNRMMVNFVHFCSNHIEIYRRIYSWRPPRFPVFSLVSKRTKGDKEEEDQQQRSLMRSGPQLLRRNKTWCWWEPVAKCRREGGPEPSQYCEKLYRTIRYVHAQPRTNQSHWTRGSGVREGCGVRFGVPWTIWISAACSAWWLLGKKWMKVTLML